MHQVESSVVQNLDGSGGWILNRVAASKNSGLWVMDAALLLLGTMVLLLALRLLRFDDPDPIYNAWLFLLGVPTVLIATSMLMRVLANEVVEKSIQLGFLISVGVHLFLVFFSVNVVLFSNFLPADMPKVTVAKASHKSVTPQYFQPTMATSESRPDYLKPVKSEQNVALENLDPAQRPDESAKLNIDLPRDEIQPTLTERPFMKPRKAASPSQPTISSTAEKLDRPDPSKTLDRQQNEIEVPKPMTSQPRQSQELQATATDLERSDALSSNRNALAEMPQAELEIQSRASQGTRQGIRQSNPIRDEKSRNRELEKALNRTASDLPERPSLLQRGSPTSVPEKSPEKPIVNPVPLPTLGVPSSTTASENPSERSTEVRSRSKDVRASDRQSLDMTKLQAVTKLEPTVGRASANARPGTSEKSYRSTLLSDNSFLADPRLAMNDGSGGRRSNRELGDSPSAPASSRPDPVFGNEVTSSPNVDLSGDLSQAMSGRSGVGKSEIGKRSSSNKSLSPTLGAPSIELGRDAWAAPLLDSPRKGLDPIKREINLPEIRDAEMTTDRLRRPETGGPKIANSMVPIPAPAFSQRLKRNREQEDSAAELGPIGPQTELAIENGLQFLVKFQRDDGSWHLEDFGDRVDIRSESAATALALLSFQGAGYTHRQFKYEDVCGKALGWMIRNQRPNGDLYVRTDPKSDGNAWLYSHAIATLALCEAYGMTQDEAIKGNAQRAIDFLVQSQDPQGGGWRYQPKVGSDTSVTGWCMMALKSAELSGLAVSKESYRGISKWLEGAQASETQKYLYRYNWQAADAPATRHGRLPTPVMTSVGLLMRLYLGWRRDNADMQQGTDWLMERLPAEGTVQNPERDTYYWYYATQVMFHMGGERWKAWYGNLYPMLIKSQKKEGEYFGSWEPNGQIPDAWGRFGGRLYVTTLNLLSLEVYYRHLPIYEATAD